MNDMQSQNYRRSRLRGAQGEQGNEEERRAALFQTFLCIENQESKSWLNARPVFSVEIPLGVQMTECAFDLCGSASLSWCHTVLNMAFHQSVVSLSGTTFLFNFFNI